jgi:hypothetical protein
MDHVVGLWVAIFAARRKGNSHDPWNRIELTFVGKASNRTICWLAAEKAVEFLTSTVASRPENLAKFARSGEHLMKRILTAALALGVLSSGAAISQTNPPSASPNPPAVSTSNADSKTSAAPVAGANSFTEAEAKKRLEAHGYSDVSRLTKDDKSIWRGKAMKGGKQVGVGLDYQGNIVNF